MLGENDVAALFATQAAAMHHHIFIDILVTHGGLGVADVQLVKGLVKAEIAHDGGHYGVAHELTPLLHVPAVDIENMVAGNNIPFFINIKTILINFNNIY
jgi:hypothetical protein